jgi:hypothetical protein
MVSARLHAFKTASYPEGMVAVAVARCGLQRAILFSWDLMHEHMCTAHALSSTDHWGSLRPSGCCRNRVCRNCVYRLAQACAWAAQNGNVATLQHHDHLLLPVTAMVHMLRAGTEKCIVLTQAQWQTHCNVNLRWSCQPIAMWFLLLAATSCGRMYQPINHSLLATCLVPTSGLFL